MASRGYGHGGRGSSGYGSDSYGYGSGRGPSDAVVVQTDGACSGNHRGDASSRSSGVGVHFPGGEGADVSVPHHGRPTNNEAELEAARRGVREAREAGYDRVQLQTDSKLVVDGMNQWRHKWEANGWHTASGRPVANRDAYEDLIRETEGLDVTFKHIPRAQNSVADALARDGAQGDRAEPRAQRSHDYGAYGRNGRYEPAYDDDDDDDSDD